MGNSVIVGALILITAVLSAYTLKFSKATIALGKFLAPDNPFLPTGLQDAITPQIQSYRGILVVILVVGILIYGIVLYTWWAGILAVIGTGLLSIIISVFLPKENSRYYLDRIYNDLVKRRLKYEQKGDDMRSEAISKIIDKIDDALLERKGRKKEVAKV